MDFNVVSAVAAVMFVDKLCKSSKLNSQLIYLLHSSHHFSLKTYMYQE